MRVTNSMMVNTMMRNLSKNLERMDKIQQSLATGKKFQKPSDDPIGVSRSLRLNTEVANMEQFKRNADDAMSWLSTTEAATNSMINVLQRARELTVKGANGANAVEDREAIAQEIEQLKQQLINIGNTTYAGSYIFSGFKTDRKLFDEDGKYSLGGTDTDPESLGRHEIMEYNVGIADRIGVNFVGQRLFGSTAGTSTIDSAVDSQTAVETGDEAQLIEVFNQLIADLNGDDSYGIGNALDRLDIHIANINEVRAEIGVKTNRLELTMNRIDDDTINLKSLLSKNEDADIAEVIMNLKMDENVYNASLSAGARIIQPSLIDFLR